jgi:hypothetical protein
MALQLTDALTLRSQSVCQATVRRNSASQPWTSAIKSSNRVQWNSGQYSPAIILAGARLRCGEVPTFTVCCGTGDTDPVASRLIKL